MHIIAKTKFATLYNSAFLFIYLFIYLFILYHIFVVKVQEITWSASYGENKTQNPKQTNQGNMHRQLSS